MKDINVLVNFDQILETFGIGESRVRAWIAAGRLVPIRREGRGRSGMMLFARGDVSALIYGLCPVCGGGFKRSTLKQEHCSRICRDRGRRAKDKGGRRDAC
jgi:hypothetical protein